MTATSTNGFLSQSRAALMSSKKGKQSAKVKNFKK